MDRSTDFYPYDNNMSFDPNMSDPLFNPMLQYEQSYMYYRSLCMQLDYKIKCKEYEKLCSNLDLQSNKRSEQQRI